MKPDYVGSTLSFDLVIVGGYYGTGRRGNVSLVTHFLLALRHDNNDGKIEYHTGMRVRYTGVFTIDYRRINIYKNKPQLNFQYAALRAVTRLSSWKN